MQYGNIPCVMIMLGDVMIELRLRDLREDRDLSQKAVANLLGVHQTTIMVPLSRPLSQILS